MAYDTGIAGTFSYRHEAEFAREILRTAGIDSVLVADDGGGAYAGLSFTNSIRLLVHNDDLDEARVVLQQETGRADDAGAELEE